MKTESDKARFSEYVKKWIQTKVAQHKFLRGGKVIASFKIFFKPCAEQSYSTPGVVVIDVIPKR